MRPRHLFAAVVALAAMASTLVVVGVPAPTPAVVLAAAEVPGVGTLDMKVLLISADGTETDYHAMASALDRFGVPYDRFVATKATLTAEMLTDAPDHGRYYAIVLATGSLLTHSAVTGGWQSALTPQQWELLRAYQVRFGVRSVTSFTYPEPAYGLEYAGSWDTTTNPLPAELTVAGAAAFPYLAIPSDVRLSDAYLYLGTVVDKATTTPLVTVSVSGTTYPVVSATTFADGRENLAVTVANNASLVHSLALSYGLVNWVTKGVFLGSWQPSLDVQIDDLFLPTTLWQTAPDEPARTYRNTAQDIGALAEWQQRRQAVATTPSMKVELAFNGVGTTASHTRVGEYPTASPPPAPATDALVPAVVARRDQFGFINHTYDHFNLDCGTCPEPTGQITTTPEQIVDQIERNRGVAAALGLPSERDVMVQPDISGLNEPPNHAAHRAAVAAGIRYWISDTSRPKQANPQFNVGFSAPGDGLLYVVPRHPAMFADVSTPSELAGQYNRLYGPGGALCTPATCFARPQTYQQIIERESERLFRYLLVGDINPLMFHTPNVRAYDGTRSLLTDLLDAALSRYDRLISVPIENLSMKQAGAAMQRRDAYNRSGLSATLEPCRRITLAVERTATVSVTGAPIGGANVTLERFGAQTVSIVGLAGGERRTVPVSC